MNPGELAIIKTYIEKHPEAAACDLEGLPVSSARSLIESIPVELSSQTILHMIPVYAARLCMELPRDLTVAILKTGRANQVVDILRCFQNSDRDLILKELPDKVSVLCRLLLGYPEDSVGAWMIVDTIMLPQNISVGDALQRLSDAQSHYHSDTLPVIDKNNKLKGLLNVGSLLKSDKAVSLETITDISPSLSSRSTLKMVEHYKEWQAYNSLPVLNRQQQVVGMLRHIDLHKGLNQLSLLLQKSEKNTTNVLEDIGEIYLECFHAMAELAGENYRVINNKARSK